MDLLGNVLVIVRGLPGSGKSTFAKSLVQHGYTHLEADQFFVKDGVYSFNPTQLTAAHRWCLNAAKQLIAQGKKVVVSNTFTTLWEIEPYLALTDSNQVVCAKGVWNSVHGVPEDTISRMKARWIHIDGELLINNEETVGTKHGNI